MNAKKGEKLRNEPYLVNENDGLYQDLKNQIE